MVKYLVEKHKLVQTESLIAGKPVVPDPHPLSKSIITYRSNGKQEPVASHLKTREKELEGQE